jgi:hypothetical protein
MNVQCLVVRLDEDDSEGSLFDSVREAYDHIIYRAEQEGREKSDYTIKPIENEI